jgi:hypothetical protein
MCKSRFPVTRRAAFFVTRDIFRTRDVFRRWGYKSVTTKRDTQVRDLELRALDLPLFGFAISRDQWLSEGR